MKKHFIPVIGLTCMIMVILMLIYSYSVRGVIKTDEWGTLVVVIGINMTYIDYWKKFFNKNEEAG